MLQEQESPETTKNEEQHCEDKLSVLSHHRPPQDDDEDTEALASFLLSLKHRSVSPRCRTRAETPFSWARPVSRDSSPPQSPYITPSIYEGLDATVDVEALVAPSNLVQMDDRDLVPDALFAAMAQMKACRLEHADRVGCYKNRDIGFLGLCCKHCGGQPGFGRYFPNSVRSLAQTTTSQTILKHIGSKCRYCPSDVRNAILELQRQQAKREGLPTGRPRYGSRKVFFQRIWERLHEEEVGGGSLDDPALGDEQSSSNSVSAASRAEGSEGETCEYSEEDSFRCGEKRKEQPSPDCDDSKASKRARHQNIPTQVSTA